MKSFLKAILFLTALAALAVVGSVLWVNQMLAPVSAGDAPAQLFNVKPGSSFRGIIQQLADQHLIQNPTALEIYAKASRTDRSLQAGYYKLSPGMDARAILHKLAIGDRARFHVTIPEGRSVRDIAPLLAPFDTQAPQAYLDLAANPAPGLRGRFTFLPADQGLEGYCFPDTYELIDAFAAGLIEAQMQRFNQVIMPEWDKRPAGWGLTLHQTLTLASIVEKEAVRPAERPVIAGIFLQRLRINMPLGADPTVEYALRRHQGKEGLSFHDVAVNSPYNTYRFPGLPPGPICNPGKASFSAVLHAQASPYLYFVARGDGSHIFTRNNNEHLQAIRQLRSLAHP